MPNLGSHSAPLINQNGLRDAVFVLLVLGRGAPIDLLVPAVGLGLVDIVCLTRKDGIGVEVLC